MRLQKWSDPPVLLSLVITVPLRDLLYVIEINKDYRNGRIRLLILRRRDFHRPSLESLAIVAALDRHPTAQPKALPHKGVKKKKKMLSAPSSQTGLRFP